MAPFGENCKEGGKGKGNMSHLSGKKRRGDSEQGKLEPLLLPAAPSLRDAA
jgi:hypothetical protein